MRHLDPTRGAHQGDLTILPAIVTLPAHLEAISLEPDGSAVVAHSETGHHHVVRGNVRYWRPTKQTLVEDLDDDVGPTSGLVAYLEVLGDHADLVHLREHDTHETWRLPRGIYPLRRQREYVPDGWRRVED